jgi:hypothetical protein
LAKTVQAALKAYAPIGPKVKNITVAIDSVEHNVKAVKP